MIFDPEKIDVHGHVVAPNLVIKILSPGNITKEMASNSITEDDETASPLFPDLKFKVGAVFE